LNYKTDPQKVLYQIKENTGKLVISNGADADGGYNTLSMYVLL